MRDKPRSRWVATLGAGLGVSLLAASCATGPNDSGSIADGEADSIELLTFFNRDGDGGREIGLAKVVDRFTEETGIDVNYKVFPWEEIESQLLLAVQSGNAPDVVFVRDRSFEQEIQADALMPLDSWIEESVDSAYMEDFLNLEATTSEGSVYAFPLSYIGTSLYLQKDVLEESDLEVPTTWDELIAFGEDVSSSDGSGFLFNGSKTQPNQLDFLQSMVMSFGGNILDTSGKAIFDDEAGYKSFQLLQDFVYKYEISPSSVSTMSYDAVTDSFAAGKSAMTITGSHRYSTIEEGLGEGNIVLAPIPGAGEGSPAPSVLSSWSLGIANGAESPDAAWQFIKFVSEPEQVLEYAKESGEVPSKGSILDDPFFDDKDVVRFFADYINENSVAASVGPKNPELNDIVAEAVQKITGSASVDVRSVVDDAVAEYNALLDK